MTPRNKADLSEEQAALLKRTYEALPDDYLPALTALTSGLALGGQAVVAGTMAGRKVAILASHAPAPDGRIMLIPTAIIVDPSMRDGVVFEILPEGVALALQGSIDALGLEGRIADPAEVDGPPAALLH